MSKILIDEAVVRQALEALEDYEYAKETTAYLAKVERATAAIRQALADAVLDKMADNARELGLTYDASVVRIDTSAERVEKAAGNKHIPTPPECKTEAEKTAYAFGWFKALESVREQPAPAQEPDPDELTIAYMSGLHEGKKIGAKEGRNKLATWMMQCGFATGHGDTLEELLYELGIEIAELKGTP